MREWLIKLSLSAIAVLAPIHAVLLTVGVLIGADLITGLMAAHKRKEVISSAALRRTVSKIVVYQIAVITGFLVEKYMLDGILPVAKLVAAVIGLVEMRSISENSQSILGYSIFGLVLKQLGSVNDLKTQAIEIASEINKEKPEDKKPSDNK